jgi:hypothetical protein
MYEFCTYFDDRYLGRALALIGSLRRTCPRFRLWALCLNEGARQALEMLALPEVRAIQLAELEHANPALVQVKGDRSPLPSFILDRHEEVGTITYLDADLFFFADPAPLFREMGSAPVAIIGHRFPARLAALEVYGMFNVGWLSFRRDARAFECLAWWQQRCLEWCYDRVEDGRFADQKYLDDWPTSFPGTVELKNGGAGVAPWNLETSPIRAAGGRIEVAGQPLVFFHFHGVKRVSARIYDLGLAPYGVRASSFVVRRVYGPYLRALGDAEHALAKLGVCAPAPHRRGTQRTPGHSPAGVTGDQVWTGRRRRVWLSTKEILRRRYALVVGGFVP